MNFNIRPVWAEVDLDAIKYNMEEIKRLSNSKDIIAVVKADAYGHGAVDVAPTMLECGAKKFAVAVITEAIELRKNNINVPIIILGYTPIEFASELLYQDIEQTVTSLEYAMELNKIAEEGKTIIPIHIAIDTGMGRIGFIPSEESINDIEEISKLKNLKIVGIFSHFSTADEEDKNYSEYQKNEFNNIINKLEKRNINLGQKHIFNSAAIVDFDYDGYDAIRPGIILYGYYPSNEVKKENIKLKPALTLKSNVVHVKALPKGKYISYGRNYVTEKESIIATLPIGYADGYTRLLTNKAQVIINGKLAPIVGNICMDQCMVDVTHIPDVKIGDEVILIGEDGDTKFNADDIAEILGTINYEILCMISKRVPRVYRLNGKKIRTRNYI